MKSRLFFVSVAALSLAACGSNEEAAETPAAEDTATAAAAPAEPDAATPDGFVTLAASSDMYEIEAGKLAEEMGESDEIKELGAMLVRDHTTSSGKLKAAAEAEQLTVPASMLPKHQSQLDALRSAGTKFDDVFALQQVTAHEEALAMLQTQAESGTVEGLKAFAAETMPVVEGHLEHVRGLANGEAPADAAE